MCFADICHLFVQNNLFTISTLLEDKEMALMWAKDLLKMAKVYCEFRNMAQDFHRLFITQICAFRARPFSVELISCQNVQVMTGRSEHTAAWSYVIKNVRKIFRDKEQLGEDVKAWSLEI